MEENNVFYREDLINMIVPDKPDPRQQKYCKRRLAANLVKCGR